MGSHKNALNRLSMLVGRWRTTGSMLGGPDQGKAFSGTDIYKWLPGESFLQHTWKVRMPDGLHRGVEILGYDKARKETFAHAYDADGTLTLSTLAFKGGKLLIQGDQLTFRGAFNSKGDTLKGTWSTTKGADPIMEVTLRKLP